MPSCEALSSRRGRGPHHVHKERVGTWEISCLTTGHVPTWSASGRRGVVADDARAREVRPRRSSCEADEQGGAIRCGAGGAKGGGRGECGSAQHGPGTEPGNRVTGAGTRTASSKAREEGEVHNAPPPHQHGSPRTSVSRSQRGRGSGSGRAEVAGLRGRP